ncbi:MAG: GTP cyclohydrolase I FolE [Bacteroidales bacterium]|nr:GTP cyclohydrolase I FolE [Bacteroidales bacterium]
MAYKLTETYDPRVSAELEQHVEAILRLLGEDVDREGLLKTPERVSRAMQFLTQGYEQDGVAIIQSALFDAPDNEVVLVKDIELHSLCEHHLLPFSGKAHVAYIPDKKITGLSKIARMVDCFARRLQVQERLTVQIRDCMEEALHPLGVAVVVEASHSCMTMRGACKSGALTTTSAFSGAFLKDHRTRNEFLNLIK